MLSLEERGRQGVKGVGWHGAQGGAPIHRGAPFISVLPASNLPGPLSPISDGSGCSPHLQVRIHGGQELIHIEAAFAPVLEIKVHAVEEIVHRPGTQVCIRY